MGIHTYGTNAVDWEQRLDIDRLRSERLARLRAKLDRSSPGAVLAFDFSNRYLKEGMVFALETYWPASDGWSAARIEEELVVTKGGCEVITRFPAEERLVSGQRYYAVGGPLPTTRETQSHRNTKPSFVASTATETAGL